jgi:hypothetical protein
LAPIKNIFFCHDCLTNEALPFARANRRHTVLTFTERIPSLGKG